MSTNDTEITQQPLVGTPSGECITLDTSGRVIRPFLDAVTPLVNEAKLQFRPGGLHIQAVDPANVAMVSMYLHRDAFDHYALDADDDLVVGMNLSGLASDLRSARKGKSTDDPVTLTLDDSSARLEIERDYDGTVVRQTERRLTIDADAIREEPDLPELTLPCETTVSPRAFDAAVDHVGSRSDHVSVLNHDGHLAVAASDEAVDDPYAVAAHFNDTDVGGEDGTGSMFSADYLTDLASALVETHADDVTVRFGDEFPVKLRFERTDADGELLYKGELMQAPRIQS